MANLRHAFPASLRKQVISSQFTQKLMARSRPADELQPAAKYRFAPAAQHPEKLEDAKSTGATRSLSRRLLALDLPKGSLNQALLPTGGKTA